MSSVVSELHNTTVENGEKKNDMKNGGLPYGEMTNVADTKFHQWGGQEQYAMDFFDRFRLLSI